MNDVLTILARNLIKEIEREDLEYNMKTKGHKVYGKARDFQKNRMV